MRFASSIYHGAASVGAGEAATVAAMCHAASVGRVRDPELGGQVRYRGQARAMCGAGDVGSDGT